MWEISGLKKYCGNDRGWLIRLVNLPWKTSLDKRVGVFSNDDVIKRSVHTWCLSTVFAGHLSGHTPFLKYRRWNLGTVPVAEYSGHRVPVCTPLLLNLGQIIALFLHSLLSLCFKMASDRAESF